MQWISEERIDLMQTPLEIRENYVPKTYPVRHRTLN